MEGYPQVPVDAHLSGRRREFAPLDSWVPVAMETIVEEDCDAEAVESYKCRERTYTFSVVTAEADAHAHMYETVPSYRNQAQSSAQSSEDSTFEPLGEPCWVCSESCVHRKRHSQFCGWPMHVFLTSLTAWQCTSINIVQVDLDASVPVTVCGRGSGSCAGGRGGARQPAGCQHAFL